MRLKFTMLCLVGILLIVSFAGTEVDESHMAIQSPKDQKVTTSYTEHNPIVITSNSDFENQGWPGNGTESNPYIIEGLNITNSSTCISIAQTTAYFEIIDCLISAPSESFDSGIALTEVTHGIVRDCYFEFHGRALDIQYSPNCTLLDNSILNYGVVRLSDSDNCTLVNNTARTGGFRLYNSDCCLVESNAVDTTTYGVLLAYSDNCTLKGNKAKNNEFGFHVRQSENCTLEENVAVENGAGFHLSSENCTLLNNTATGSFETGSSYPGGIGFHLDGYHNTLMNNTATDNSEEGFLLEGTENLNFASNVAINNSVGVKLKNANNCSIRNNKLAGNGFVIDGWTIDQWLHEMSSNTVNELPVGYFKNLAGTSIDGSLYSQAILANCSDVEMRDGLFYNVSRGVQLGWCSNCTITNSTNNQNSEYGLYLRDCKNSTLANNSATNNQYGMKLLESSNCTLVNNSAIANLEDGFGLERAHNSTLKSNTAIRNGVFGISLDMFDNSTLIGNTAVENLFGISLKISSLNTLFLNHLGFNSQSNGYDDDSTNSWDNGTHGNYWSDYDGMGVYRVPGEAYNLDYHPFVLDKIPPTVNCPADIEYEFESIGHTITWNPSDGAPVSYEVYQNRSLIESGAWIGNDIVVGIDGLAVGVYNYTLVISDRAGNTASDTVFVTVIPSSTATNTTTTTTTPTTTTEPAGPAGMNQILLIGGVGAFLGALAVIIVFYTKEQI